MGWPKATLFFICKPVEQDANIICTTAKYAWRTMVNLNQPRPPSQLPDRNLQDLATLCFNTPFGAIVEVGVFKGGSAWVFAQVANDRPLHLFDTFRGIPEQSMGDLFDVGAFSATSADAVLQAIPTAVVHAGVFPYTLPEKLNEIAFAHIDCDQQKTCRACIKTLWPRMVTGGVMAFDDYPFPGIKAAIDEFFGTGLMFTEVGTPYVVKKW